MRFPEERLRQLVTDVLTAWGMSSDLAAITAEVLVDTDLAGIESHGVALMLLYEQLHAEGELDLSARPRIVRENPASALVDAFGGLGHPAGEFAMQLAITKAVECSVGVASVVHSHHFGAAGYYAALAAKQGLIGMVTSSANLPCGVPTGAAVPMLATNPIAFAAPTQRNHPFLLDMATTTVASNKVKIHDFHGRPLPAGWVLDEAGEPIRDAALARHYLNGCHEGGLTMLGGTPELSSHKGYGLAMMAHVLAATLSGGSFPAGRSADEPHNIGHFFLAIDPAAFRPGGAFERDLDEAIDRLHAAPALDPRQPVLVAGDPQARARQERSRDGVPLAESLVAELNEVCARAGTPGLG